ncbi:MAG: prepilin-type N-terminal cleavage/methylation domain-containing protein [Coxiellaceae bacterium]|nr:prepilin-type N-terminal cleavage/methylation domain-containing protein [Coxiellaceae bacterium]
MLGIRQNGQGFTLIELMVALAVSSFVLLGVIGLYLASSKHNKLTMELSKLDSEMHNVLSMIEADVRPAGYWAGAGSSTTNPFMVTGSTDLYTNPAEDCILTTYDKDGDGNVATISSASDDERYGYRLVNGVIQYRPWGAAFDCNAATNVWTNLTDPNITQYTQFVVSPYYSYVDVDDGGAGTDILILRNITIHVRAQVAGKPGTDRIYIRTIRVHNDKYVP